MDTGHDSQYQGSDSLRALWRCLRRTSGLSPSRRSRPYSDGRVSARGFILEEHSPELAGWVSIGDMRGESRRQHQESGPETDTEGTERDRLLDEHGVCGGVQAVALAALHQICCGVLPGRTGGVLPRVRLRVDFGRVGGSPDEQCDWMSSLPPVCAWAYPSTSSPDADCENEEGSAPMVVHECGDVRPFEAGLHDEERHWELGIWLGSNRGEDGDSLPVECEGMVGGIEDDAMLTAAQKLKNDLQRYVENFALEFDMNKWTAAGVLEEVKTDVLFESDSWPQPDIDEDDE